MAEQEKDKLLDHDADGIKEYDNSLPRWWLYGFYFTIVMGVIYMFYYHVYDGPDWDFLWYGEKSQVAEYEAGLAELEEMRANAPQAPKLEMKVLTDEASLAAGKEIFVGKGICQTCHREDMGGQVGPNLTDEYWIHGCSIEEITTNITTGFPEKGMIAYGSGQPLTDLELMQVASYILSMQGTNPPDPKPVDMERAVVCPPADEAADEMAEDSEAGEEAAQ